VGSTFGAFRRALADALDDLGGPYAVSASTASTVTVPALATSTPGASPNRYDGRWVYLSSGAGVGQVAKVRGGGFASSVLLTMETAWTTAPVAGDQIELYGWFPAVHTRGSDSSYSVLINNALSLLVVPDRVSLPITTNQEYSLATLPWLDRPERLRSVLEPGPTGGLPADASWRRPRLRLDANLPVLEIPAPFSTASGTLILTVMRPSNTWIKVNGVWGESTVGLVNETDEANPATNDVVTIALAEAYRALMSRAPGRPSGPWAQKYAAQLAEARRVRYYDTSQERAEPAAPAAAAAGAG
jgi:hypothetical protein